MTKRTETVNSSSREVMDRISAKHHCAAFISHCHFGIERKRRTIGCLKYWEMAMPKKSLFTREPAVGFEPTTC